MRAVLRSSAFNALLSGTDKTASGCRDRLLDFAYDELAFTFPPTRFECVLSLGWVLEDGADDRVDESTGALPAVVVIDVAAENCPADVLFRVSYW